MNNACPICEDGNKFTIQVDLGETGIYFCNGCSSGVMLPRLQQSELTSLHTDSSYYEHPYFQVRRTLSDSLKKEYQSRLDKINQFFEIVPEQTLLEVGCDTGLFLQYAEQTTGLNVVGVDISNKAVTDATKAGVDVRLGTLEMQNFPTDSFDIICAYDLIEHIESPAEFLAEVRRILKPTGILILETPNFDGIVYRIGRMIGRLPLINKILSPLQKRLWPLFHVQYFTAKSLSNLLNKYEFSTVNIQGKEITATELSIQNTLLKLVVLSIFKISKWMKRPTILTSYSTN